MTLTFDAELHEYRADGVVLPSVTQILQPLTAIEYAGVSRDLMDRAAALGRAVHRVIELDLLDDLDVNSLTEALHPYYLAWRNFQAMSGFACDLSEHRVHSARYGYAGTLDLAGTLNGRFVIIDAKRTAQVPRTAGPQTAAYRAALAEGVPQYAEAERYALHLRKDGTWRLVPFPHHAADLRTFLACLTVHQWSQAA